MLLSPSQWAAGLERLVRCSLWLTAPLNIVIGYALAFPLSAPGQLIQLPPSEPSLYTLLSGILVALFGVAYFWLVRQPVMPQPLLLMGAAGKFSAATLCIMFFLLGKVSLLTTVLISGDLALAGLWCFYLYNQRSNQA